jgi:pectate lyase
MKIEEAIQQIIDGIPANIQITGVSMEIEENENEVIQNINIEYQKVEHIIINLDEPLFETPTS